MSTHRDLERRISDFYSSEAPPRAPDWLLDGVLAAVDSTHQRPAPRRVPWRFLDMPTYARFAVAAVVVAAVGVLGLTLLRPGAGPGVGGPSPTPSSSPSPSATASRRPTPTQPPYVPPALTQTFVSAIHGISIDYPEGWVSQAATQPWADGDPVNFLEPVGDFLYDATRADPDHLFLLLSSQPGSGASLEEWSQPVLAGEDCSEGEPIVVGGADGLLAADCNMAFLTAGDRHYLVLLYTSGDDSDLRGFEAASRDWFQELLATVRLQPADAVDELPSPSP